MSDTSALLERIAVLERERERHRKEAYRQRRRAETWRHRALRKR